MNNSKYNEKYFFFIGFILAVIGLFYLIAYAASSYRVNSGDTVKIDEWGVCKKVTNNNSLDIFVPTNTDTEWADFRNNASGVTLAGCSYYLFITASTYNGNLGGRSGADDKCNSDANKPSDCSGDAWAFISVDSNDEIRDMPSTKKVDTSLPWYWNYNGTTKLAANNWSDLLDGAITNSAQSVGYDINYWTGSHADGSLASYNCQNWTTSYGGYYGYYGDYRYTNDYWLGAGGSTCDANTQGLLCACF